MIKRRGKLSRRDDNDQDRRRIIKRSKKIFRGELNDQAVRRMITK